MTVADRAARRPSPWRTRWKASMAAATMRFEGERRTQEQEENKGGAQPDLLIEIGAP
jgi:hypothetical protein